MTLPFFEILPSSVDVKMSYSISQEKCQKFSNDIKLHVLLNVLTYTNLAYIVMFLCNLYEWLQKLTATV